VQPTGSGLRNTKPESDICPSGALDDVDPAWRVENAPNTFSTQGSLEPLQELAGVLYRCSAEVLVADLDKSRMCLTCGAPARSIGRSLRFAWLLLSSSRDSPQPESTAAR
jgi:hypothetical protein